MKPVCLFLKYAFGVLLVSSVLISCKKDNGQSASGAKGYGNISYFATTSLSAVKTGASSLVTNDNSVVIDWASASVYVTRIAFVGQSGNVLDTTITIGKNLDIFSSSALAGVIQLPAGSYKNVSVKMYCEKSAKSDLAFNLKGTFTNTKGGRDSVMVGSSLPFTANLTINDIVIDPSDKYTATFKFDLTKVMTGITNTLLETARTYTSKDNKLTYVIWKGGSAEEPFFNQVVSNWQTVASVVVTKQ